jgi:hypothetical protein
MAFDKQEFIEQAMDIVEEEDDKFLELLAEDTTDRMLDNWMDGKNYQGNSWGNYSNYTMTDLEIQLFESGDMHNAVSYEQIYDALKNESEFSYSAFPPANKGGGTYAEIHQPRFKWHPEDFNKLTDFDQTDVNTRDAEFTKNVLKRAQEVIDEMLSDII